MSFLPKNSIGQDSYTRISFDFYGGPVELTVDQSCLISYNGQLTAQSIQTFETALSSGNAGTMVRTLLDYKKQYHLDDWLYYQLIRKTAQQISPKADNYYRYTLYKWFLLTRSGYDATLKTNGEKLLFYVQSDENIYNIPFYLKDDKQYVCLNYHDYGGNIDFSIEKFTEVLFPIENGKKGFSYKVTHLPDFKLADYEDKDLQFTYKENNYHFKVKLNPQIKTIFANYPVVDYESYFNIPLSNETYSSLIPLLKKNIKGMNTKNGVDYLMRFTRYAFLFETDSRQFGKEKRLSPEQTLLFEQSDCEDRAALFFYLVKEIYNLPIIVMAYPEHVTIAVKFAKPVGTPILYNGLKYSVCEPTPQRKDLAVGQLLPTLRKETYEVVYAYTPHQ
ncbi:MAG: hypothetical protein SGI83_08440 [Bacteroidota bacterium]|nr:hypothetical protein [Bacteroidota bacterium]